ncbi:ATP-binding protein [Nonomuraea sp. B10E15]|uniref:ATP-binding protein n=1 Tax=Nonomuraea sp. B10E15 TaxID=3153560 RepID=UPI00325D2163
MNVCEAEAVQLHRFGARPSEVRRVRHFVGDLMAGHPSVDDVVTAVSELAANAVQHSASGGADFMLRVAHVHGAVRIEVTNAGGEDRPELGRNDPDATAGRGLFIVDSLSRRWGVVQSPAQISVWCEIDCIHSPAIRERVAA